MQHIMHLVDKTLRGCLVSDNESDQLLETVCWRGRVELHWGEKNMDLSHLSKVIVVRDLIA